MRFTTSALVFLRRIALVAAHSIRAAVARLLALGYSLAQSMRIIAVARTL